MTAIFFDITNKILVCDSQATDYVTYSPVHYDAIKYGRSKDFISVTAGNSSVCDTFNTFIKEGEYETAKEYLKFSPDEDLQAIVIHIGKGKIAGNLSNGLFRRGCRNIAYGGTGGDILRHNYVVNDENLQLAYDITTKDRYTYTGGEMRRYDFNTGEGNMNELDVVQNEAANDEKQVFNYPVGEKSFDAEYISSSEHEEIFDFEDLLNM